MLTTVSAQAQRSILLRFGKMSSKDAQARMKAAVPMPRAELRAEAARAKQLLAPKVHPKQVHAAWSAFPSRALQPVRSPDR